MEDQTFNNIQQASLAPINEQAFEHNYSGFGISDNDFDDFDDGEVIAVQATPVNSTQFEPMPFKRAQVSPNLNIYQNTVNNNGYYQNVTPGFQQNNVQNSPYDTSPQDVVPEQSVSLYDPAYQARWNENKAKASERVKDAVKKRQPQEIPGGIKTSQDIFNELLKLLKVDTTQMQLMLRAITRQYSSSFMYIRSSYDFRVLYFGDGEDHIVPVPLEKIIEAKKAFQQVLEQGNQWRYQ